MSNHANQSVTNVASTALNFSDVYLSHLSKIKACIRKLDHKAGFKRSTDQTDELAQDFFTKVWADSILDYFDPSRAKSKDAILAYLYNHLRNFYSSIRTKEIRYAETNKRLKEFSTLGLRSNSNLFGTKHDEDTGFCHDIKKVGKAFVKSLRGLEKKAWKEKVNQTKFNLKTVHLDEQKNDLYKFSDGKAPCVVGESEKGLKLIFSNSDLDSFNGDVALFFKSLEDKINKIF